MAAFLLATGRVNTQKNKKNDTIHEWPRRTGGKATGDPHDYNDSTTVMT
jgi:hypothetical protein